MKEKREYMTEEELKTVKKRKIIIISIVLAVVLFLIYNVIWYFVTTERYKPLLEALPVQYGERMEVIDGMTCSAFKGGYLKYTGNLCVVNNKTDDSLLIFPKYPDGYEYVFDLAENVNENSVILHTVNIDKDGNLLKDEFFYKRYSENEITKVLELYKEKEEMIDKLLKTANEIWDLSE